MKNSMIIHPDELSKEWIDKLRDAGIGTLGIHPCGGKNAFESLEELLKRMQTPQYRDLIDYAHSCGVEVEYELHAMGYLLMRDLFGAHPEYFRMNENGERTSDYNLCVSNPDALDLVAKNAVQLAMSLYGSTHDFYFWLDDGRDLRCNCPLCRDLSASDQQMIVLNRMLCEIRKHIPDARMAYLAYVDSLIPPSEVKVGDGIFLEYAPFEKYTANNENAEELITREREMIVPLMKTFDKEPKKVLEYWYDNSLFSEWKKPPNKFVLDRKSMLEDISQYRETGFDCISTFACFLGKDYEELYGPADITDFSEAVEDIRDK